METRITLVGAGPGDEELITLKGLRALEQADVILYDDLANQELLRYAPTGAMKQYVGKRVGRPSFSQEEINALLVSLAKQYGHVVRLKGGDSYVFGRGHEEYVYAREHGIDCQIIPGISSCIAVPASQHIPVTRRGVSESFWVITGTTRHGELSEDLKLAVQSRATVVVLMGLQKIQELCQLYINHGRGELPMAVIQNGTRPDERCVLGQVWEMPERVAAHGVGAPAVLVIGEVVTLHPAYIRECLAAVSCE
ncbi:uroporphyrinogen-III C-methyltransferase [Siphonobacter sp. BAB-5385]|uniref:uroporphyrinogen-III C-methyltransferase n=1 Tax=Siphonobacter sp. BAB-5385 TaxID=1864822 RepID=UPI000B9DE312|nr:uroporphyrinogen-III C-methyltransferase [Siphonobacter sp. BAB-5385]OZI05145.1 uroporphyrinogen-III C-methyltransferase [Siphonobacter sp. BAB-5385]